jgi:hypothetical protein
MRTLLDCGQRQSSLCTQLNRLCNMFVKLSCLKSKLKTEIALSTMEAEYVALSTSYCDLFPLIDITNKLCTALQIEMQAETHMHIKLHKDNVGALILGKLEPQRMTPQSKHYAVKYHWFCEHIGPQNIQLIKISSETSLAISSLKA